MPWIPTSRSVAARRRVAVLSFALCFNEDVGQDRHRVALLDDGLDAVETHAGVRSSSMRELHGSVSSQLPVGRVDRIGMSSAVCFALTLLCFVDIQRDRSSRPHRAADKTGSTSAIREGVSPFWRHVRGSDGSRRVDSPRGRVSGAKGGSQRRSYHATGRSSSGRPRETSSMAVSRGVLKTGSGSTAKPVFSVPRSGGIERP